MGHGKNPCARGYIYIDGILPVYDIGDSGHAGLEGPTGLSGLYPQHGAKRAICVQDSVRGRGIGDRRMEVADPDALGTGGDGKKQGEYGQEVSHVI